MRSSFEQMGGTYHYENGYLIPHITLPTEEEKLIGIYGKRHLRYLKEYRKVTYTNLLTSGELNAYLADIDKQARERLETIVEQMKQKQGVTEQLKAEKPMEWVGFVNSIRSQAMENVNTEIIYR